MSTIRIQLLKAVDITKPNASKTYQQMVVTHNDLGSGKLEGKKIFDFSTPKDVWETLKNAAPLSFFEVDRQKDAKEGKYWEWKAIRAIDGAAVATPASTASAQTVTSPTAAPASTPARVGNWETPEERNAKQVYIVRQSSITAAISYLNNFNDPSVVAVSDVLKVAAQFEAFVFGQTGVAGLDNDIPE